MGGLGFSFTVTICQILVAVAGFMTGDTKTGMPAPLFFAFCALQLLIIGYLICLARGTRLPLSCLRFSVLHSLIVALVATMSFRDIFI
jgi:hypothetical protein